MEKIHAKVKVAILIFLIGYLVTPIMFVQLGLYNLWTLAALSSATKNFQQGVSFLDTFWAFSIVLGIVSFFFGVLGIYGARQENRMSILTFNVFNVISIIITISLVFYVRSLIHQTETELTKSMNLFMKDYYTPSMDTSHVAIRNRTAFDTIQKKLKCCGVKGPTDWVSTKWYKNRYSSDLWQHTPDSCCHIPHSYRYCQSSETYFSKGCYNSLMVMNTYFQPIIINCGFHGSFSVVCFIAGMVFFWWTKKEKTNTGTDLENIITNETSASVHSLNPNAAIPSTEDYLNMIIENRAV